MLRHNQNELENELHSVRQRKRTMVQGTDPPPNGCFGNIDTFKGAQSTDSGSSGCLAQQFTTGTPSVPSHGWCIRIFFTATELLATTICGKLRHQTHIPLPSQLNGVRR
jgi:hypothetical protein